MSKDLLTAIEKNDEPVIDVLLNAKVNINFFKPDTGVTPLLKAVEYNNPLFVKKLLANGANPHIKNKQNETALLKAIQLGNTIIVDILLSQPSIKDSPWILSEALLYAAYYGQCEIVKKLLEIYKTPNLPDQHGFTALMMAQINGKVETIQEIIRHYGDEAQQREKD